MPSVHRARWMDAEGNGRKIIVNAPLGGVKGAPPDYKDKVGIYAYNPRNDLKREVITEDDEGVLHGIQVVDWDGKGRDALLSASFMGIHLHRYNNGKWVRTRLTPGNADPWPKNGASDVVVLRTKAGRQLASIEPWHGNQVVVYRGKGETWDQRTVIDDTLNDGHTLVQGDLDGDGVDEIVAGYRGGGGGVNIYRLGADNQWTKHVVATPEQKSMAAARLRARASQQRQADRSRLHRLVDGQLEVVREPGQIILASRSPRRAELLTAAGISFEVLAADIDETPHPNETPAAYVERLAIDKARAVLALRPGARVLGADTTVTIDGEILGKPVDAGDAARMLRKLSGRPHDVHTGVAVVSAAGVHSDVETTRVWFAPMTDEDISWYVGTGEPVDRAGAYAIQGLASRFIPRIEGSYSNVVGLPVAMVSSILMRG